MRPRSTPLLAFGILTLATTLGCSESEESTPSSPPAPTSTPAPPFLLDDALVENVIGALGDLRAEYRRRNPPVNPQAVPASIGVGITLHVPGSEKITKAHGFDSNEAFERALGHIQFTLPVVVLGEHRGLDDQAMRNQLENFKQSITQELERTRRDQSLSTTARRTRELELERQLTDIDSRIEETRSVRDAMTDMSRAIPDQNVAAVKKYADKLIELLNPSR